jgi:hypothetical protein
MNTRADTIRQRMEADIRRTLHSVGMVSDFMEFGTYETLVNALVEDAMHPIEKVLAEQVETWEDGYNAGHEDARAVQPTYPEPTRNPYR